MVFPNGINVKNVASENAEWLVALENHYPQWLMSKKSFVKYCVYIVLIIVCFDQIV